MPEPNPRFAWHPEPELLDIRESDVSRAALEDLGRRAWSTAVSFLYDEAFRRAMGDPAAYEPLRKEFFGPSLRPAPAPTHPSTTADLLAEFTERIAPHNLNAWHPRTLSYFTPPPLVMSIVGELLTQVMQQGVDVWHAGPAAAFVEEEVVRWLCDLVGYGEGSFGLLASGGVMANFMAMALARDIHLREILGSDVAPRGAALEGVRVYVSDQAHFSIGRAVDELGFPPDTLSVLPSDDLFRLRAAPVAEAVTRDRAAGLRPLAIAAVAGATNTGAVDALPELADLAEREGLWFHIDAAYGGAARFSERIAPRVPDLHRAHSVTVDPHKWFFQAYDIGALVVRDGRHLARTFSRSPEYYGAGGELDFYKLGFEGTRRWRALKLWMSWKHIGTAGFGRFIEMNVDVARYLADRLAESDDFEMLPEEPALSIVCFRHVAGVAAEDLDQHQLALQVGLEATGNGWLSTTTLRGSIYLRAGVVNQMTTTADIDEILSDLRRLAAG